MSDSGLQFVSTEGVECSFPPMNAYGSRINDVARRLYEITQELRELEAGFKSGCGPLSTIPTCELVNELLIRNGVMAHHVGPYEEYETKAIGPAIVLTVTD